MTEAAAPGPSRGRAGGLSLRGPARLLSDERLVRRATQGDPRAFEQIFRRYHQHLYRFCLATVSNPQDAQEALQNTMVKVMRALPGEQREIKLKPWLFRIARNEAVETMRKRRDTVELSADRVAAPAEIAEATDARDRLRELFTDLAKLPERQRSALVMRELAGFEFGEIGEAFGTSAAVARQTLYEARQNLRQMDEGREMSCASVRRAISDADGRVTRRRDIRAHLRDCVGCRAFRDEIARRRADFAAVAPLPAAVSTGLLQGVLSGEAGGAALAAGAGGAAGGSIGGAIGVGAGKAVAGSALIKSAATVAVVAAVGAGAADRGGLIDLPRLGDDRGTAAPGAGAAGAPTAPDGAGGAPGGGDVGGRERDNAAGVGDEDAGAPRESASKGNATGAASDQLKEAKVRPTHENTPQREPQDRSPIPPPPDAPDGTPAADPSPPKAAPPVDKGQSSPPAGKPPGVPSSGAAAGQAGGKAAPPSEKGDLPSNVPPAADGAAGAPATTETAPAQSQPGKGSPPVKPRAGGQIPEEVPPPSTEL